MLPRLVTFMVYWSGLLFGLLFICLVDAWQVRGCPAFEGPRGALPAVAKAAAGASGSQQPAKKKRKMGVSSKILTMRAQLEDMKKK